MKKTLIESLRGDIDRLSLLPEDEVDSDFYIERLEDINKPIAEMSIIELQQLRDAMKYQVFLSGASNYEMAEFQEELLDLVIQLRQ